MHTRPIRRPGLAWWYMGRWSVLVVLAVVGAGFLLPAPGGATVRTTSSVLAGGSPFFFLNDVSQASVDISSPSAGADARTRYVVDFSVSSGLSGTGSNITVTFPSGTTFGGYTGGQVIDVTNSNTQVGSCRSPSGLTIICYLFSNQAVAPATT